MERMTTTKLTKEDLKIMKSFKTSRAEGQPYVTIVYDVEQYSSTKRALIKSPRSFSLHIDLGPTNNCQMASIKGFYSACYMFRTPLKKTIATQTELGKRQRIPEEIDLGKMLVSNSRIQKLVVLKAMSLVYELVTRKKLYFIDIPIVYKEDYYELHPFLFKKRLKSREVEYTSTNGNRLMYSLIELDLDKLDLYK